MATVAYHSNRAYTRGVIISVDPWAGWGYSFLMLSNKDRKGKGKEQTTRGQPGKTAKFKS